MDKKLTFYAPIEKTDDEARMVYGYASTEALDSQGEVVKKEALSGAIDDYMKWANIREMHQPSAVGKTKKAQLDKKGLYIAAKIVDNGAWAKVKEGVYSGFSIGGRVGVMKDNEITSMTLSEISLVDRPANPECKIDVFKIADMKKDKQVKKLEEVKTEVKVEETKPVEAVKPVEEVKPVEVKTVDAAVAEAKEKVSKPDLIKVDAICSKEDFAKVEKPEVKKCLEYVAELAMHLNGLHHMEERYEQEEKWEGEDPAREKEYMALVDALKALGEVLKSLATKAVEEMLEEEKEELKPEATPIGAMVANAEKTEGLEKVGKEISTKNSKAITAALADLQAAIDKLSALNTGGQLTEAEEKALKDGLKAGSEVTSGGHVAEAPLTPPAKPQAKMETVENKLEVATATEAVAKVEDSRLAKAEGELALLKEQFAKLQNTALPIKAKASFVTVEKFEGDVKGVELQKAEVRANELEQLLKYPHDAGLEKEAATLSLKLMRLRREAKGGNY